MVLSYFTWENAELLVRSLLANQGYLQGPSHRIKA